MKFSHSKVTYVSKRYFRPRRGCVERARPLLRLFKLCGILANEITEDRLKRCSWPSYGICTFWVSVYISYACFLIYIFRIYDFTELRTMAVFVKHLMGFVCLCVYVTAMSSSQNHFIKFFDRLASYDGEVARMGHGRNDNPWTPWIVILCTTVINTWLLSSVIAHDPADENFFMIVSDVFTAIMHIVGTVQQSYMLHLMTRRYEHLNARVAPGVSWDEKRPGAIGILDVKVLYAMLYDAQEAFGGIYRNPLLMWFASLMIRIVTNIRTLRETVLIASCFIGPPFLQVLILCTVYHRAAAEANRISCVLSKNMCTLVSSGRTTDKIGVLAYFLHNRVSFDAAGFFTINLPLLQSIVAAVTTYFIILM